MDICWKYLETSTEFTKETAGSPQFLWFSRFCDRQSWCHSGARNAPYHPFQRAECARVCFVVKLVRLRKKILLKFSNNAPPKPVLAGGRAARLSHQWRRKLNVSSKITGPIFFIHPTMTSRPSTTLIRSRDPEKTLCSQYVFSRSTNWTWIFVEMKLSSVPGSEINLYLDI